MTTETKDTDHYDFDRRLRDVAQTLVGKLTTARRDYGESWIKRGGTGAYMVAMRKVDRLEQALPAHNYDLFAALKADTRPEGIADDIQDLAAYLLLWIEYADRVGVWPKPIQRGVTATPSLTDVVVSLTPPPAFTNPLVYPPRPRVGDDPHDHGVSMAITAPPEPDYDWPWDVAINMINSRIVMRQFRHKGLRIIRGDLATSDEGAALPVNRKQVTRVPVPDDGWMYYTDRQIDELVALGYLKHYDVEDR